MQKKDGRQWLQYYCLLLVFFGLTGCSAFQKDYVYDGLYWSADYSEFLQVTNNQFVRLQWDPVNCHNGAAGLLPAVGHIPRLLGQYTLQRATSDAIELRRLSDNITVRFDAVATLPDNCFSSAVSNNMHQLLSMRFNLLHFNVVPEPLTFLQLQQKVQLLDASIADDEETELALFELLANLLASLQDQHAFLYARPLQKYQGFFPEDSAAMSLPVTTVKRFCNGEIEISRIADSIWYLKIYQLLGFTERDGYSAAAEVCIADWVRYMNRQQRSSAYHLIVDLANNGGGSMQLAAAIYAAVAGFTGMPFAFLDDETVTAAPILSLQYKPVKGLVLVNQATASAAEHLALALRQSGFTLAGQQTLGAFSPTMVKTLPNGWFYGFSMYQNIRDQHGSSVPENVGLIPDCPDPLADLRRLLKRCG